MFNLAKQFKADDDDNDHLLNSYCLPDTVLNT